MPLLMQTLIFTGNQTRYFFVAHGGEIGYGHDFQFILIDLGQYIFYGETMSV